MTSRQQAIGVFSAGVVALIAALIFSAWYLGFFAGPAPAAEPSALPPQAATPAQTPAPVPPPSPEAIAGALAPKPSDIGVGDPKAPVKWVDYVSAGCPHCADEFLTVFPKIKTAYIDTGKVYFVLRDYPLDGVSAAASMLARCLPPAKFYSFMTTLFSQQKVWHSPDTKDPKAALLGLAAKAGLKEADAEACLKDQTRFDILKAIAIESKAILGVAGTPTNFVNGEALPAGANSFEAIEAKIKEKLGP